MLLLSGVEQCACKGTNWLKLNEGRSRRIERKSRLGNDLPRGIRPDSCQDLRNSSIAFDIAYCIVLKYRYGLWRFCLNVSNARQLHT